MRDKTIPFRASSEEKARYLEAAGKQPLSDWIRDACDAWAEGDGDHRVSEAIEEAWGRLVAEGRVRYEGNCVIVDVNPTEMTTDTTPFSAMLAKVGVEGGAPEAMSDAQPVPEPGSTHALPGGGPLSADETDPGEASPEAEGRGVDSRAGESIPAAPEWLKPHLPGAWTT